MGFVNENINHLQSLNAEEYHRRVVAFDLRREFNKYVFQKKFDAHSDQISFREFQELDFENGFPDLWYDLMYFLGLCREAQQERTHQDYYTIMEF